MTALSVAGIILGCGEPTRPTSTDASLRSVVVPFEPQASDVNVTNVEDLYRAVNDATNAGKRVVLAAGMYPLSASDAMSAPRPKGGRLELQTGMSLVGQTGNGSDVVIDAGALPASSYAAPPLTGAVRLGKGSNSVIALTVQNAVSGASAITTDLVAAGPTLVHIEGVIVSGSVRGIDIRNLAAHMSRTLEVELIGNELYDNALPNTQGQGLRFVNSSAPGAVIHARLIGNRSHDNLIGCLAANLSSSHAKVEIESTNDKFDGNGNGCILLAGNNAAAADISGNVLSFKAVGSSFSNNRGTPATNGPAGIVAQGATTATLPTGGLTGSSSYNSLELELTGVTIANNGGPDVAAWGAQTAEIQPTTTNNVVRITTSVPSLVIRQTNTLPAAKAGDNQVLVVRIPPGRP